MERPSPLRPPPWLAVSPAPRPAGWSRSPPVPSVRRERRLSAVQGRVERLREKLPASDLDALLVSQPEWRYYLSGYHGHDLPPRDSAGYLLVTREQAYLLTDGRTVEQATEECPEYEVLEYGMKN